MDFYIIRKDELIELNDFTQNITRWTSYLDNEINNNISDFDTLKLCEIAEAIREKILTACKVNIYSYLPKLASIITKIDSVGEERIIWHGIKVEDNIIDSIEALKEFMNKAPDYIVINNKGEQGAEKLITTQ